MTKGTITLAIGGLTLAIDKFTDGSYPRERLDPPNAAFSARGNPCLEGTSYEPKHIWNLQFRVTEEGKRAIETMYQYFLLTNPVQEVFLDDYSQEYEEPVRTRALATGASETALTTPAGWTRYYAKFKGWFTSPPQFAKGQQGEATVICALQITETTKAV